MKHIYLSLFVASSLYANEINPSPSFQGFRGAINTPNTEVMKEGEFEFLYTNQIENISGTTSPDFRDNKEQKNFLLNMGFLPNLDLNFQYAYGFDNSKDIKYLSNRIVNAKYKLPFIPSNLLSVAIGIQDIGGGNPYIGNKYAVASKEFNNIRTNIGYAIGDTKGSIDGPFGSIEYQPLSWLQIVGEYDSKEWNGAIKGKLPIKIGKNRVDIGAMAKSSIDYNDIYFGLYASFPFNNKNTPLETLTLKKNLPSSIEELKSYGFSNISYHIENNIIYFEYENTLYTYNDIDALGVVLGTLAMSDKAKKIVVVTKKSNIKQLTTTIDTKAYQEFLKTGKYNYSLLQFSNKTTSKSLENSHSDRFKPTITFRPDFVLVDGSEYTDVAEYTIAMQVEASMRLSKGTILSSRYNIPIAITDTFKYGGAYDYRNRNKTKAEIDQILLSQYFQFDLPYRWVNLAQIGQFDKDLTGISFESEISTKDGKHSLIVKGSKLKDDIYKKMDRYYEEDRDEELIAYRYYSSDLNSNIKLTAGDFLYGDSGYMFSMERYFNDTTLRLDIAQTEHLYKGDNTIAKLTLSIPLGSSKKVKTDYFDIQGDYAIYEKRKAIVHDGETAYAQPLHLKEVDNSFTLEKYYLNNNRFHPTYIKSNYNRLRNVFLGD